MEIYITFGQIHKHSIGDKVFDKDCVAVIEAMDAGHGRKLAFEYFGNQFCMCYSTLKSAHIEYYSRGLIYVDN